MSRCEVEYNKQQSITKKRNKEIKQHLDYFSCYGRVVVAYEVLGSLEAALIVKSVSSREKNLQCLLRYKAIIIFK